MSRSDPLRVDNYLGHIFEAFDSLSEYTADMDIAAFWVDKKNTG